MISTKALSGFGHALAVVALLIATTTLAACTDTEPIGPNLNMPNLVGQAISAAENQTYATLHTSLIYYDLSPANRSTGNDWVVAATSPAAGAITPKYQTVYAWLLRASEYAWFMAHPTMPAIAAGTSVAKLVGTGGLLAPVKDLIETRYEPGKAPVSAVTSPLDASAFAPDRGITPDMSTEPTAEWTQRQGLLVAPESGLVAAGSRPASGSSVRTGQLLVLLVVAAPPKKHRPPPAPITSTGSGSGSHRGSGSGSHRGSGSGTGSTFGGFFPHGVPHLKFPACPKKFCG